MYDVDQLAALMAAHACSPEVQVKQTRFRVALAEAWEIPVGARVLEIGCGQGDMTAALANAVGPGGHVTAVDLAEPGYGAPVTLGDSARHLAAGPLGDRIDFQFECDVLDPAVSFDDGAFDCVVLAHCTWYFASLDALAAVFRRVRPWAARLRVSEWDLEPRGTDQLAHHLAVLIQGQLEAFKPRSESNVRTPSSREALERAISDAGWRVTSNALVDTSALDDARWEIATCLQRTLAEADALDLPPRHRAFLASQVDVLRHLAQRGENRSLCSRAVVAV